ncbi:PAS domain-containing protein [Ammoniphilus sp. YIM 78166]|uniref:PAS domain-containing protein n=1 Tax=Ammoniphilus sp. YIM 78166 TaxID=1644106 RepID=UPI001F10711C|nr:PAS domain-containing protein [Ammoniphilus sp. YIM 78166]
MINSGYHPKSFFRNMWNTISRGQIWTGECKNRAKDGSFYWVKTVIVPFLDEQARPQQYVSIRTDITDRVKVEAALRESQALYQLTTLRLFRPLLCLPII